MEVYKNFWLTLVHLFGGATTHHSKDLTVPGTVLFGFSLFIGLVLAIAYMLHSILLVVILVAALVVGLVVWIWKSNDIDGPFLPNIK